MQTKTEKNRAVKKILQSQPTLEGAGVKLRRVFGHRQVPMFDPFLMLDDFRSDHPEDYLAGFPWHPHRGIETITYILQGRVEHGDSMGNRGIISAGDVQWMTAGSGIIHQEMPKAGPNGAMYGFQLWANLPATHKMMEPRYREIRSSMIPEVGLGQGCQARIICGKIGKIEGPVRDVVTDPEYLDITLSNRAKLDYPVKAGHTVFVYVIGGEGWAGPERQICKDGTAVLFADGDYIRLQAGEKGMRLLVVSGKPLNEPVAWSGPIVMNTDAELEQAFSEYEKGTFIKHK